MATAVDRPNPTGTRPDALIEQLRSENGYLRDRLVEAERERERVLRQMADERERFDVIHRTALDRIEALSASVGGDTANQVQLTSRNLRRNLRASGHVCGGGSQGGGRR